MLTFVKTAQGSAETRLATHTHQIILARETFKERKTKAKIFVFDHTHPQPTTLKSNYGPLIKLLENSLNWLPFKMDKSRETTTEKCV